MPPVALNTYHAPHIATLVSPPAPLLTLPALVPQAVAAPNLTAATAIDIGTVLPYSTVQNVNFGGTTQTVWYKYVAQTGDVVIGVFGFGDLVAYSPTVTVFSPDGATAYLSLAAVNRPLQLPVIVGNTYYFRFSSGNVAAALLHLSVRRGPKNTAPTGAVLINDDTPGLPAALLSALDGTMLHFRQPFAAGEGGDVLNTGELCFEEFTDGTVTFYDKNGAVVLASAFAGYRMISTNKTTTFYLGHKGGGLVLAKVTTASALGVAGPTTWTFAAAGLTGMAPSPDETILYYTGSGGSVAAAVKRWDLVNNVALTDLVAGIVGFTTNDIVVLSDGTGLVLYYSSDPTRVRHYSTAGATLNTYTFTGAMTTTTRICRAIDDPTSFWIFLKLTTGFARIQNIKVSDGSTLTTFDIVNFEGGAYQGAATATPSAFFGPSQSCPILIARSPLRISTDCPSIT